MGEASIAPNYQKHSVQILFLTSITFINLRIYPKINTLGRDKNIYLLSL